MASLEEELKTIPITDPYRRAFLNILYTANVMQNKERQTLEPFGLTGSQYNVLRILRGQPTHCLATYSIRERMIERSSDATRIVDRLMKVGLVARHSCPNDKRSTLVQITEKGLALLEEIDQHIHKPSALQGLTREEARLLSELLDKARIVQD